MELRIEDVKATIIRLQGQMDVWQGIYQRLEELEKAKVADDSSKKS